MTTSANGSRGQRVAEIGRVGQRGNAAVPPQVDPAGQARRLALRRRLEIGAVDPDRRRADEPFALGRELGVDLANIY